MGFHEVSINFLGSHSFLTEVLDNHSDFRFLYFANVSYPPLLKVFYIKVRKTARIRGQFHQRVYDVFLS